MNSVPMLPTPDTEIATEPGSADRLSVMTWNVQHASAQRSIRQAAWLAARPDAQVVVLTEVGHGPGGTALIGALSDHGYTCLPAPVPDPADYRTVIASRCATPEPLDCGISVLAHRAIAATVDLRGHKIAVLGLYVPSRGPREHRNRDKRAFQEAAAAALPALLTRVDGPLVATGDLNVLEPGHRPHYRLFGKWEYDFYRAFPAAGLADTYRLLHPDTVEHSWYGRGGNGYRFDHTFVTAQYADRLLECRYLHASRRAGLSDHSAMTATVALTDPVSPRTAAADPEGTPT